MAENLEQGETWRGLQGHCFLLKKYQNLKGKRMNLTLQELSNALALSSLRIFGYQINQYTQQQQGEVKLNLYRLVAGAGGTADEVQLFSHVARAKSR